MPTSCKLSLPELLSSDYIKTNDPIIRALLGHRCGGTVAFGDVLNCNESQTRKHLVKTCNALSKPQRPEYSKI